MNRSHDTRHHIRGRLAMVVPIWYPPDVSARMAADLLGRTLADVGDTCRADHVALVVDGQKRVARLAEAAATRAAARGKRPHVIVKRANQGKGAAVRDGMAWLLAETRCEAFVARDSDADHDVNDLLGMFRLLHQMRDEQASDCALVIGARADRRRPMGLARGETELWLADFHWHAMQHALAREGRVVNATYMGPYGWLPDLLSGYKMYTREAARLAVAGIDRAKAECPDLDMGRYGGELVPLTEVLLADGTVGQMIRRTFEGQPCSGFAGFDPVQICSARLLWACRRLALDPQAAFRLFDNACARSPLSADATFAGQFSAMRRNLAEGLRFRPPPPTISAFC